MGGWETVFFLLVAVIPYLNADTTAYTFRSWPLWTRQANSSNVSIASTDVTLRSWPAWTRHSGVPSKFTTTQTTIETIADSEYVAYQQLEKLATNFSMDLLKTLSQTELVSEKCKRHVKYIEENVATEEQLIRVLDAMAKFPSGLLSGTYLWLGNFDECINIKVRMSNTDEDIVGKYCMGSFQRKWTISSLTKVLCPFMAVTTEQPPFRLAVCVPSVCNATETETAVQTLLQPLNYLVRFDEEFCQVKEPKKFDTVTITVISVLCVVALMMIVGTVIDKSPNGFHGTDWLDEISETERCNTLRKALTLFSVKSNLLHLIGRNLSFSHFKFFDGIRVFSMMMIILGQTYAISLDFTSWTNVDELEKLKSWAFGQFLWFGVMGAETFIFISVFMTTYKGVISLDKVLEGETSKSRILVKVLKYYFTFIGVRYLRMTVPLVASVGIAAGLIQILGSGPRWAEVMRQAINCRKNWYLNVFHVSNFIDTENMCLPHTWYSAVDMQMTIITVLIFIVLYFKQSLGKLLYIARAAVAVSVILSLHILRNYSAIPLVSEPEETLMEYYRDVYIKPYTREITACVAMYAAHSLLKMRGTLFIPMTVWTTYCMPLILGVLVFLFPYSSLYNLKINFVSLRVPFLAASTVLLLKYLWSFALHMIFFSALSQNGNGFLTSVMGCRLFQVMEKLTLCVYLVHYPILIIFFSSRTAPFDFDKMILFYIFVGTVVLSYGIACILYLAFDRPTQIFCKWLFKRILLTSAVTTTESNENYNQLEQQDDANVPESSDQNPDAKETVDPEPSTESQQQT